MLVTGSFTVTGGNAAKVDFSNVTANYAEVNPGPVFDQFVVRSLGLQIDGVPFGMLGFVFTSSDRRTPELRAAYLADVQGLQAFKAVLGSQIDKTIANVRKRGGK